jgi:hypothetical protein
VEGRRQGLGTDSSERMREEKVQCKVEGRGWEQIAVKG